MQEPKQYKRIVYNKTFAQLFAANKWALHLRLCCVSRRAYCAVLPDKRDTSRHVTSRQFPYVKMHGLDSV